jgi:hypothetical protein
MNANSRPELDELLGAYALDAIEPVERFEMDQYLTENYEARHEVDELRETAAWLALLQMQREPIPERVWDGIQSAIRETPSASEPDADVLPLRGGDTDAVRRRRAVPLPVAALLVAAASVAIVLLAARHNNSGHSLADGFKSIAKHGHVVSIVGNEGTLAQVVQTPDGTGYMKSDDLPALPPGKVYQLWVIAPGRAQPISAGVIGRRPRPYETFAFEGRPQAYALSIENAPGAVTPSTPIGEGKT